MKYSAILFAAALCLFGLTSCGPERPHSADEQDRIKQEQIQAEGTRQAGLPVINNFREKKLLKQIIEDRDREILTYTYIVAEQTGKLVLLGESVGYGIPAATQYTNPQKVERFETAGHYTWNVVTQADPNGLFSPASAEGTWVMMKDPASNKVTPVYIEPRVIVSPFKFPAQ